MTTNTTDTAKPTLLSTILGRDVQEGERLTHEDKLKVGRHVASERRSALAVLAKS